MSKVDAQRAMREAKYARLRASGPTRREAAAQAAPQAAREAAPQAPDALVEEVAAAPAPDRKPTRPRAKKVASPAAPGGSEDALLPVDAPPTSGLCGHKSMNGRTCTREAGHAEKSHRYG